MASMPSDSELEIAVREILRIVNVEEASLKSIRQKLEARFEVGFKFHRKQSTCSTLYRQQRIHSSIIQQGMRE